MLSRRAARLCLAFALSGAAVLIAILWNGGAPFGRGAALDRHDRPAIVRALEQATGNAVDADRLCIAAPEHFPDLVVVQASIPDGGCRFQGVFVRGRWHRATPGLLDELAPEMLASRGWARADAESRRSLAIQWVVEVVHAGRAVTDPAALDPRLRSGTMAAPASEALPEGGVIVRLWVIENAGGSPRPARVTFVIGRDGTPGG